MMMFRNSDWSRGFLAELSDYAHLGEEALLQMRPVRIPILHPPSKDLCAGTCTSHP